ncbi:hypothetical protein Salat_0801200 [Sesamum alatum]|uniref:Uncharacterized protein n=1 Tax=Sesamum alatum TaxID=300844 RepID=A0AAE1YTT3_9LAMI|nr:hypothetical protein Salat_0801200 [Sesamum alatum]
MHACNARPLAGTTSISHKVDDAFWKRLNPMEIETSCEKKKGIGGIKSGSEDCNKSSDLHDKGLLHPSISQGASSSRWSHDLNVREMEYLHPSVFREEDLSETDYQPSRRKSPIHNK